MIRIAIGGTLLVMLAAVASFLAPAPASPAALAAVHAPTPDRIAVVRGGIATPLGAGEQLAVTRDIEAVVRFSTISGARYARTLSLTLADAAGPVDAASVRISAHMRYMDHGAFSVAAALSGNGAYVAVLPFAMPGEWEVVIEPRVGADTGTIVIDIDAYE